MIELYFQKNDTVPNIRLTPIRKGLIWIVINVKCFLEDIKERSSIVLYFFITKFSNLTKNPIK